MAEAATLLEDGQLRVDGEEQGWGQRLPEAYTLSRYLRRWWRGTLRRRRRPRRPTSNPNPNPNPNPDPNPNQAPPPEGADPNRNPNPNP